MIKNYSLILVAFLLSASFATRVFLMGGGVDDDEADVYNAIALSTGRTPSPNACQDDWSVTTCPRVAVVTSASPTSEDGLDEYEVEEDPGLMSFKAIFKFYGMSPKHVTAHVDNYQTHTSIATPEGKSNLQILTDADVVIFNGGDQSRHARTWLNDDGTCGTIFCLLVRRARNNEVVLAGTSAGTMIMSNPTYGDGSSFGHLLYANSWGLATKRVRDGAVEGTNLRDVRNGTDTLLDDYNGGQMTGFGFVPDDYIMDTHYDRRGRLMRMIPGMRDTHKNYGIGVDEGAVFFMDGTVGKVLGQNGVFIVDMTKASYTSPTSEFFNVQGVRVHYLTPGDKYNFNTHQAFSSKPRIQAPKYNDAISSDEITSRYECTKLITHLVDQVAPQVSGVTLANEDFPEDTHVFKVTFTKDSSTVGYKEAGADGDVYTAVGVLVSITDA